MEGTVMEKARVVGFDKKLSKKFKRMADWINNPLFLNACTQTAEKLGVDVNALRTKRQASKFIRGEGIVFKNSIAEGKDAK